MKLNARTARWLLAGWTAAWFAEVAWHGGLVGHSFVHGAQALADADVLALVGIVAALPTALAGRSGQAGLLLGLAVDAKLWARLHSSQPDASGVADDGARRPDHRGRGRRRLAALLPGRPPVGIGLGILALHRFRWAAVPLLAVGARIALDPGTDRYQASGAVTAAAHWDLAGKARFPWWTAAAAGTLFASRWIPMQDSAHGASAR